jgi:serpin B
VYHKLARREGNFLFSPYSVSSALVMAYAGAGGETAEEMARVLRLAGVKKPHSAMRSLTERFDAAREDTGKGVFSAANRVWVDKSEELLPSYTDLVWLDYGGGVEPLDFKRDAEDARRIVNEWTARETRGKVQDLLQAGDVDRNTRLVLTNAVYFSSGWARPFEPKLTSPEPFHAGQNETRDVPMMRITDSFSYGETPDLQFVRLPYRLPGFSLLVLLPRASGGLSRMEALEKALSPRQIAEWISGMTFRSVSLSLPKFRSEERYSLSDILAELGMRRAFSLDADFSEMVREPVNEDGVLHIDSLIHQAFIELDEKGTEAAAATAVTMARVTSFRPETPVEFCADRPFAYCLMDDRTGVILFMGRLSSP